MNATIMGVPKGNPRSGQLLIRLSPELLARLRALAEREKRSATAQVEWIVQRYLDEHPRSEDLPESNSND